MVTSCCQEFKHFGIEGGREKEGGEGERERERERWARRG